MAAETSIDAQVPVVLALVKLALFYGVDVFSKEVSQRCISVTVLSVVFAACVVFAGVFDCFLMGKWMAIVQPPPRIIPWCA